MKKFIAFLFILCCLSCEKKAIYKQYQAVGYNWEIIEGDLTSIDGLDLSGCQISRRQSNNANVACAAAGLKNGSIVYKVSLKILPEEKIEVVSVRSNVVLEPGTSVISDPTVEEIELDNFLTGIWSFSIDDNQMNWIKNDKVLRFDRK